MSGIYPPRLLKIPSIRDSNGNTIEVDHIVGSYSPYGSGVFTVIKYAGSNKQLVIQKQYQQSGTIKPMDTHSSI
jgi:hypothetical protein